MKKILVPVDFSDASRNAYYYALNLAAELKANIDIVYVHIGSMHVVEPAQHNPARSKQEALAENLIEFKLDVPDPEVLRGVDVHAEAVSGLTVVEKLIRMSGAYELVVMATKGDHDLTERMLGTVSSGLAQHAKCPVLLVPAGASFQQIRRILSATNWESVDDEIIGEITAWADAFGAHIDFVHIGHEYELEDIEKVEENLMYCLRDLEVPGNRYSIKNIRNRSARNGITQYARDEQMDLIILVNRQRNLITNLLGKSMTKEMGLRASLPVLVLHYHPKL